MGGGDCSAPYPEAGAYCRYNIPPSRTSHTQILGAIKRATVGYLNGLLDILHLLLGLLLNVLNRNRLLYILHLLLNRLLLDVLHRLLHVLHLLHRLLHVLHLLLRLLHVLHLLLDRLLDVLNLRLRGLCLHHLYLRGGRRNFLDRLKATWHGKWPSLRAGDSLHHLLLNRLLNRLLNVLYLLLGGGGRWNVLHLRLLGLRSNVLHLRLLDVLSRVLHRSLHRLWALRHDVLLSLLCGKQTSIRVLPYAQTRALKYTHVVTDSDTPVVRRDIRVALLHSSFGEIPADKTMHACLLVDE